MKEGYKKYQFGIAPLDWEIKQIGDIFNDLRTGSTPSRTRDEYYTGNIPWITSGELKYKTIYHTLENITEEAVKDTNLMIYPIGTFFIAITGLEAAGTRGSCAISGIKATTNQSCLAFIPRMDFNNKYLFYWYLLHGEYIGLKYTQGTKQQSLNNKIVQSFEIPVPPLSEQQKIADILSTVDEQIDNVNQLIEKTKELKKGIMQQLLTKGIGHTEFKETELGIIPKEWEVKKLEDVAQRVCVGFVGSCNKYYTEDTDKVIMIRTTNMSSGRLQLDDCRYVTPEFHDKNKKSQLVKGDVLIARHGEGGKPCLFNLDIEANCLNIVIVRPNYNKAYPEFLKAVMDSDNVAKQINEATVGSVQNVVNTTTISSLKVVIPTLQEQEEIISILEENEKLIQFYEIKNEKLQELKKGLMQQLLTGKIRVITEQ